MCVRITAIFILSQLKGVNFAMEFLTKNQKRLLMTKDGKLESNWDGGFISAEGKDVIVIGVSARSLVQAHVTSFMLPPYSKMCDITRGCCWCEDVALEKVHGRCHLALILRTACITVGIS